VTQTSVQSLNGAALLSPSVFGASSRTVTLGIELPTLAVALAVYGGFGLLTWFFRDMHIWVAAPLTAAWLTWYGSLQHETIHGHPSRSRRFNKRIASLPLSLWIPYRLYRLTHLQHHRHGGRRLTDVGDDPETFYQPAGSLLGCGTVRRTLYAANRTLAGRLVIGPLCCVLRFWAAEARKVAGGDRRHRTIWLRHVLGVALVYVWISRVCHIPPAVYVLLVVYPSMSLTLLRSFVEHRADADASRRTVAVEAGWMLALLFLNNNLHIAHHAHPRVPWYRLPKIWREMSRGAHGAGLVFRGGYGQVITRYLWRPVISAEHPGSRRDALNVAVSSHP
jgi:fatty acid desaturase